VFADQTLELAHELLVTPERELNVDPLLERAERELLRPGDLRLCERLIGDVRERRTSPQRQRFSKELRGMLRIGALRLRDELLGPMEAQLAGLDAEEIARGAGDDRLGTERLP